MRGLSAWRNAALVSVLAHTRRVPRPVADRVMGTLAMGAALFQPRRVASAYRWAQAHKQHEHGRWPIMFDVLAQRGRTLVDVWSPVFERPNEFRTRVRFDGREHLDRLAGRPIILLGFHLGTPLVTWALSAHGYEYAVTAETNFSFVGRVAVRDGWPMHAFQRIPLGSMEHGAQGRAVALFRLRQLLQSGQIVRVIADGRHGPVLFHIPAPTGALAVRSGWWWLRRQTGATIIPALGHRTRTGSFGSPGAPGAIVTLYPPLPEYVADEAEDLERCRAHIVPLVQTFIARHPNQLAPWRIKPRPPDEPLMNTSASPA